ncbi:hypothetical protein [Desulfosporosinus acidiphilus]|nr:hypothetical protein [Desulfosporosinus acidiphilus]
MKKQIKKDLICEFESIAYEETQSVIKSSLWLRCDVCKFENSNRQIVR